jgi:uncharacterized YigZ family protein
MYLEDTYRTLKQNSTGTYKEKGSKFIAIATPVNNEFEVNEQLKSLRKEYHDANHWCFAYRLGYNKLIYRFNDDGEPSGTAGKPIYGQILSNDLTNILVVVVRYFGGRKLGVSGLINAYKIASKEALSSAEISLKTIDDVFSIDFDYKCMNDIMKIIKEENVKIINQNFDKTCSIKFNVRKSKSEKVTSKLKNLRKISINFIETV